MKEKLKSIQRFFDWRMTNFFYWMVIAFGMGYFVYITFNLVLESNNCI